MKVKVVKWCRKKVKRCETMWNHATHSMKQLKRPTSQIFSRRKKEFSMKILPFSPLCETVHHSLLYLLSLRIQNILPWAWFPLLDLFPLFQFLVEVLRHKFRDLFRRLKVKVCTMYIVIIIIIITSVWIYSSSSSKSHVW